MQAIPVSYTHLDVYKRQTERYKKLAEALGVNINYLLSEDEAFIADVEDNYGHRGAKPVSYTHLERDFDTIVAVRGKDGSEIIPPCGNCRQILHDYMPDCEVILSVAGQHAKIKAKELLPFSYTFEG